MPPLDDTLKKITHPDPELLSECKSVVDEFRRLFELKENPKVFTTKHHRLLGEKDVFVVNILGNQNVDLFAAEEVCKAVTQG